MFKKSKILFRKLSRRLKNRHKKPLAEAPLYQYLPDGVSFISEQVATMRMIYAPLCGIHSDSIKSSITPFLSGDIKIDKDRFLTKPASRKDLRQDLRNFFVYVDGKGVFSLTQESPRGSAFVEVGQLWHKLVRRHPNVGLELEALNFVPVTGDNAELMRVTVRNTGRRKLKIIPTAALPIFGRALANKHDHEHVTSLLHRISQLPNGVLVEPVMTFNEEGHRLNETVYYVLGSNSGANPKGTFPTVENFYGENALTVCPEAVLNNRAPEILSPETIQGKEAVGALRFQEKILAPGDHQEYFLVMGIGPSRAEAQATFERCHSAEKFAQAFEKNKSTWFDKTHSIKFTTGDPNFNSWMQWVTLQPILRRIFGNSFLPDHDYGKGGKGWRDLWQDLLSLVLIEPENVRENLINNFAGVRIDGSNATIIGTKPGEFFADRNNITRVWMDHGTWPFLTTLLYVHQTGDLDVLFEKTFYFRDRKLSRTFERDLGWSHGYGNHLKSRDGEIYTGTILEHLLVQNLVQFFNVGEHNIIRLESADWNDGLDMAFGRGESVAFMSFYGGNLLALADLLETIAQKKNIQQIGLSREILILLDSLTERKCDYNNPSEKRSLLFETYFKSVQPEISGEQLEVNVQDIVHDLRKKGHWIFDHIHRQEKVAVNDHTWFNGYYDNQGRRVEGQVDGKVWMTLTGQVFSIMSGLANEGEIKEVVASVRRYLQDKTLGGFRLNTDFGLRNYLGLGRAFSFAYGTKENGAFFSHMTAMYAYALYKRGFVREGYQVLRSIYTMAADTQRSKIYPGVPEYFDSEGRGMYHYLTGSASWLVLTQLTQVFGVRGEGGALVLSPKLVIEEFSKSGEAQVSCQFAGKKIFVSYVNKSLLDYGGYQIKEVFLNDQPVSFSWGDDQRVIIKRELIGQSSLEIKIRVVLGEK